MNILIVVILILCIAYTINKQGGKRKNKDKIYTANKRVKNEKQKTTSVNTRKLNIISNREYDKNINSCYNKIVQNMSSSMIPANKGYKKMNKMEEIFIKEFLYQVQFVRQRYYISLTRYATKSFAVYYNSFFVGRINLSRENNITMQVLIGLAKIKEFSNLTFDEALQNIRYWICYIKNYLKEQRF